MRRILLDNDTGVDDALALVYLASRDDVALEAVTCTPGNVSAAQVARNNLAILELCGRPGTRVVLGAEAPLVRPLETTPETHGPQGIGHARLPASAAPSPGHAPEVWVELARAHPGELDAVCTAPLTNLALALRLEPRLPELLRSLTVMGGAYFHPGNTTPLAEWNVWSDPHAAAEVFAAYEALPDLPEEKLPLVCGLETTERFELTPEHVAAWRRDAGPVAGAGAALLDLLEDALRFYFEFHEEYGYGYISHVHDYFATAAALGAVSFAATATTVDVQTGEGPAFGATMADVRHLLAGRRPNARLVTGNDPVSGFEELHRAVVGLARRLSS